MLDWWDRLRRGPVLPALPVCLGVAIVAVQLAPDRRRATPRVYSSSMAELPPGALATALVAETKGSSVHHLRVVDGVKPHLHRRHDESIVVLAGQGRMVIASDTTEIGPGSVIVVPRGTVHSAVVTGDPLEAISVFSPPFHGNDRVFVHE